MGVNFVLHGSSVAAGITIGHAHLVSSARLEVAHYRIAEEALANVARHARATHTNVSLHVNGALELIIEDDGSGIAPDARGGLGLRSMRERAEELGGSCEIGPGSQGGTRVVARLPLARESGDGC